MPVNRGDILMLYTGWDDKFDSPDYNLHPYLVGRRRGMDGAKGHQDVRHRLHHGRFADAARPKGFDFPVHQTLLGNEVLIAENVTNLGSIVGKRTRIMALPLRVKGSDAGHARIIAEILN